MNKNNEINIVEDQSTTLNFLKMYQPIRKSEAELRELATNIKNATFDQISEFSNNEKRDLISSEILEQTSGNETPEIGNIINNIVKVCQIDPRKKRGFISRIIGIAEEKIEEVKRKYSSVQQHLDSLIDELSKEQEKAVLSRKYSEQIMTEIFDEYYNTSDILEAFKMAKEELEQELNVTSADEMQAVLLSEGKAFHLELIEQNIAELITKKAGLKEQEIQIIRQVANKKRVELSYNSIVNHTRHLWKNAISIYIQELKTKHSINIISSVQQATDQLWIESAKSIADNSKDIFNITNRTILSVDALFTVKDIIHKNIIEIQKQYEINCNTRKQNYIRLEQIDKLSNKSNMQQLTSF